MTATGQFLDGVMSQSMALWALSNIPGFPPIIQSAHILGIAVVMGSIVMLDLRILGLAVPSQQLPEMANRLMPWLWWALASNLVSGSFFVFARPLRYFNNPIFGWKMVLLILAGANMAWFHFRIYRRLDEQGQSAAPGPQLKIIGALSLALWSGVVLAGRWVGHIV